LFVETFLQFPVLDGMFPGTPCRREQFVRGSSPLYLELYAPALGGRRLDRYRDLSIEPECTLIRFLSVGRMLGWKEPVTRIESARWRKSSLYLRILYIGYSFRSGLGFSDLFICVSGLEKVINSPNAAFLYRLIARVGARRYYPFRTGFGKRCGRARSEGFGRCAERGFSPVGGSGRIGNARRCSANLA